jgi:PAS domain S-box-containing protein
MNFFRGISFRIWLPFAISITFFILAAGFYYPQKQEFIFMDNYKSRIKELAKTVALGVELTFVSDNFEGLKKTIDLAKASSEFEFIAIVEKNEENGENVFLVNPDTFNTDFINNRDTKNFLYESAAINTSSMKGYVLIGLSKNKIRRQIFNLNFPVYQFLIILLLVSLMAFMLFANSISKPIRDLTDVADNLKRENFDIEIKEIKGQDEISNLNNSLLNLKKSLIVAKKKNDDFNKYLEDEIALRTRDLEETKNILLRAQKIAKIGNYEFNLSNKKWNISTVGCEILRIDDELKCQFSPLEALSEDSRNFIYEIFDETYQENSLFQKDIKISFNNSDKEEIWISFVTEPVRNEKNEIIAFTGTIQDITERKIAENEINRLSFVAKKTSNLVIITDADKKIVWANDSLTRVSGYTFDEVVGKSPKMFQFEKTNPETLKYIKETLENHKEVKAEILNRSKNGQEYWLDINIVPLLDQKNEIIGYIAVETDISERKKYEEEIVTIKDKLESILNEINDVVWSVSLPDRKKLFISPSCEKLYEMSLDNWNENDDLWIKIIHPDDISIIDEINHQLNSNSEYSVDYRVILPNGKTKWINKKGKIIYNKENQPLRIDGVDSDITELKLSFERQKSFIKEAPSAMAMLDNDMRYVAVSDKWITDYKLEDDDIVGKSYYKTFPYLEEEWMYIHKNCLNGKSYSTEESRFKLNDGSSIWLKWKINPWFIDDETIGGIILLTEDITKLKESKEEELKHILKLTQSQNDRLKNFAHIVSHNLRSHSSNIQSLMSLMIEERPELKEDELAVMMQQSSENLLETISHLSEVAIMNVKENEPFSKIDLSDICNKAIKNVSALAINSNVSIVSHINKDIFIDGIPAYLDSIFLNFLTNGIKYKSNDKDSFVKINSELLNDFVLVSIEDNGLGIDLKRHGSKLFGMYKTFHKNSDARGIGLFITKNQIEAMGGKIEVESEVGKGTIFKIYLKLTEENNPVIQ